MKRFLLSASSLLLSSMMCFSQGKESFELSPVLDTKLDSKTNTIYCATFELAWNELKKFHQGKVLLKDGPDYLEDLNKSTLSKDELPKDSCVVAAGKVSDGIVDKIDQELKKKLKTSLEDLQYTPGANARLIAFAYLQRNLPFRRKFTRFRKKSIQFQGGEKTTKVTCFGCTKKTADRYTDEVKIRHYKNTDDFILQLRTRRKGETIVLAKMARPKSMKEAVYKVYQQLNKKLPSSIEVKVDGKKRYYPTSLSDSDTLLIPVMKFDVRSDFTGLLGKQILNPVGNLIQIGRASQWVQFSLDEKGAKLKSSAEIELEEGGPRPRKFIFDKPFLICLWKKGEPYPYFAAWVNNPDVMLKK